MTKKDYILITQVIAEVKENILRSDTIDDNQKIQRFEAIQAFQTAIQTPLKLDNPLFDYRKFDEACLADNTELYAGATRLKASK